MSKYLPEMKRLMDKKLSLQLNGNRGVEGVLRGYDQFMNIVLEDAVETSAPDDSRPSIGMIVVRGNSIVSMEVLGRVN
ncbi:hypothetical protein NDN08_000324 [Rhodosorus marinus]|uniref:Small nuclear ribonucleoprotein G n=1 Tax=Rhodosorus marinus TaxID=101924 RepID=A0AAV8UT70_9RHOD|nr:hypothetical protein NDN08_000324 [Rhodosorus marinus]|eukprot:CAMPEP_0113965668 /NCGR_PEP_ID=MMETSP0011_2-20120614/7878_1 /TAXON_ID=101924 /ORGANISM="Rhodosorus marinus" /LENGTH=77 /DNA_ID=CAMNT_0000978217 /DNA_START=68 /DNA_END=301 /DNA_ORIENTATION=- /assembly_acc=CAM_ASM_000156